MENFINLDEKIEILKKVAEYCALAGTCSNCRFWRYGCKAKEDIQASLERQQEKDKIAGIYIFNKYNGYGTVCIKDLESYIDSKDAEIKQLKNEVLKLRNFLQFFDSLKCWLEKQPKNIDKNDKSYMQRCFELEKRIHKLKNGQIAMARYIRRKLKKL